MFKIFILFSLLPLITACQTTTKFFAEQFILPQENVRDSIHYTWTERNVGFTTADGVRLLADIHHPKGLSKTPTILVRIPFTHTFGNQLRADIIARYWARRGYTAVIQGTRGRYESEGEFYPLIHERSDGIQTLKWLEKQHWYNGKILMWGGSSFGHTQWAVSDQTSPGPSAYFIHIASSSFREMFYPGGAFSLESALYWAMRSRGPEDKVVNIKIMQKSLSSLPNITADDRSVGDTKFYNDWLLNENNDKYWNQIDGTDRPKSISGPALLLAGWFDPFLPTQLDDFQSILTNNSTKIREKSRIIIGPWTHASEVKLPNNVEAPKYRISSIASSIPWFDELTGIAKNQNDLISQVRIYVMGKNEWRNEDEWPLARTRYVRFYVHSTTKANSIKGDGYLNSNLSEDQVEYDTYVYDPDNYVPSIGGTMLGPRSGMYVQNVVEERDDVLVYSSAILEEDIEVTGLITAELYVKTDVVSTDFTVKLVDVYPDGHAYNLSDGILRRDYDTNSNCPEKIEIQLWPTSNLFKKGHRIRIEISSSNYPRYNINPNTGEFIPTAIKTIKATQEIFHTNKYPSHIILPIIDAYSGLLEL